MKKLIWGLFITCLIVIFPQAILAAEQQWSADLNVSPTKQWTIHFSDEVDRTTLNGIIVVDENGQTFPTTTTLLESNRSVVVKPARPYEEGALYHLKVTSDVKSVQHKSLKQGVVKTFIIETSKPSEAQLADDVQVESDLEVLDVRPLDNNRIEYTLKDPDKSFLLHKGSKLLVQQKDESQNISLIVMSVQDMGTHSIITALLESPLEQYENIWINETVPISASDFASNPAAGYTVASTTNYNYVAKTWEPIRIDLKDVKFDIGGKQAVVNGKLIFEDLEVDYKFDRKWFKIKELGFSLSGAMTQELEVQYNFFSASNKVALPNPKTLLADKKLAKEIEKSLFNKTVRIPQIPALSIQIDLYSFLELALAGGGSVDYVKKQDFNIGYTYKNGKEYRIGDLIDKSKESSFQLKGHAETEVFTGLKGSIGLADSAFKTDFISGYIKAGGAMEGGMYMSPSQLVDGVATGNVIAATKSFCSQFDLSLKGQVGVEILPALELADVYFDVSSKPWTITPKTQCEIVENISVQPSDVTLKQGESTNVKVYAHMEDIRNGTSKKKDVTKHVQYKINTNAQAITIKDGNITATSIGAKENKKVNITAIYKDDRGQTFEKSFDVIVSSAVNDAELLQQLKNKLGADDIVEQINFIKGKKHFITIQYEREFAAAYEEPDYSNVTVYEFDANTFKPVYKQQLYGGFTLLEDRPALFGNQNNQAVLVNVTGSERFLSFLVLGTFDQKKISAILDKSDAYIGNGNLKIGEYDITACNGSQGTTFYGFTVSGAKSFDSLCNPVQDFHPDDVVVYYTIDANHKVKVEGYQNGATIKLQKDRAVQFIRTNHGPSEVIQFTGSQYKIIPNGDDFKNAFTLNIQYK